MMVRKGDASGLATRKYELIGDITARSGAELPQYFKETFTVIPDGNLPTE